MAVRKGSGKRGGRAAAGSSATRRTTANPPSAEASAPPRTAAKADPPVVAIGASAGGLEALRVLFHHMPADSGLAFVVITHQHPGHTSMLPELLGKETRMPVAEAANGLAIEANHVYVCPPAANLAIMNGVLHLMPVDREHAPRLPIDYFLRTLAEDRREKAIGIILSGTGTDGTLGVKAIKGESGMVMAEEPSSAAYAGMPSSAIATGFVDYVLQPAAMPRQLLAYTAGPYLSSPMARRDEVMADEPMQKIFVLLRSRTGHDFSAYKPNTMRRRIERRMNVQQIMHPHEYAAFLQDNPHEIDLLFKELLIGVTNFFRDPEAWDALANAALDPVVGALPEDYGFRVWVPGCSTGEEVFSAAIVLLESMERSQRHLDVQIFGTDLDEQAIATARTACYPDGIAVDVTQPRLERFFAREDGHYRVRKAVRDLTVFAIQNVIRDPPFTKLDLICCRNLLIYLDTDLQHKLLPLFHYALKPEGVLFLGSSETTGAADELFTPLDKRWKIFRRREDATAIGGFPDFAPHPADRPREKGPPAGNAAAPVGPHSLTAQIGRALLARFAPASVVTNEAGDIVHIHGRTGAFLEFSEGQPRSNVLEMAREGLRIELAAAMRRAAAQDEEVRCEHVRIGTDSAAQEVDLTVSRLTDPESLRGLLLVTFRPVPSRPAQAIESGPGPDGPQDAERVWQLERELRHFRETHQITLEELETSNEELKASNEELQSTNEELQSTNEELETSKEEMQSLNEELTTVNAELQSKVEDLSQANDDMQNLLNSTGIATVFLDNDMNVKRYTEEAKVLFSLRPTDVGRPLAELRGTLEYPDLVTDCMTVQRTLNLKETELASADGNDYLMRIVPYRTKENVIDGLVMTFVNIDRMRSPEEQKRRSRAYFESIVNTISQPLVVLDEQLRVVSANAAFYRVFRLRPKLVEDELIYEIGGGEWDIEELRGLLEEILPKNATVDDFTMEADFSRIGHMTLRINARRLESAARTPAMILLAISDVSGR